MLHIGCDVPKTGWVGGRLGVVCGPESATLAFVFHHDGCAKRATLTAWIEPGSPPPGTPVGCGPYQQEDIGGPSSDPARGIASASVVVFAMHDPGLGCANGEAEVHLTLAPVTSIGDGAL